MQPPAQLVQHLPEETTLLTLGNVSDVQLQPHFVTLAVATAQSVAIALQYQVSVSGQASQHEEPGCDQVRAAHNNELVGFAGVLSASKQGDPHHIR